MTGSPLEGAANAEVAVVIVNYATPELTMRAVAALAHERNALPNLKAVVVDGGSPDNSTDLLTQQLDADEYRDWLTFIPLSLNGGFGWANNQAILELARRDRPPEFIHFLNPDTEVNGRAVVALVEELLAHPKCGAAGSLLLNADKSVAASAFRFPTAGCELVRGAQSEKLGRLLGIPPAVVNSAQSIEVDWVTGASFMVRAAALQESGLFDDGFFLYFEEVELMHRLRLQGWSVRHVPDSRVMHLEGAATGLGATDSERPHPSYWYRSRRRYFGLTGGWTAILGSAIAALAGQTILGLKQLAGRTPGSKSVRTRDLVSLGLWPTAADVRSSVPKWGDLPGRPPAWMKP